MYSSNLQLVVGQYNTIMRTLLAVERPLVEHRIDNIDRVLGPGLEDVTWRSDHVLDFINEARVVVRDLYGRMNFVKGNVKSSELRDVKEVVESADAAVSPSTVILPTLLLTSPGSSPL